MHKLQDVVRCVGLRDLPAVQAAWTCTSCRTCVSCMEAHDLQDTRKLQGCARAAQTHCSPSERGPAQQRAKAVCVQAAGSMGLRVSMDRADGTWGCPLTVQSTRMCRGTRRVPRVTCASLVKGETEAWPRLGDIQIKGMRLCPQTAAAPAGAGRGLRFPLAGGSGDSGDNAGAELSRHPRDGR